MLLAVLAAVMSVAAAGAQENEELDAPDQAGIAWLDLPAGIERMEAGSPGALFYFTAEWCQFCRQLEDTTLRDPRVVAALEAIVPIQLDVDTPVGWSQSSAYGLDGVPALVLLHDDVEWVLEGYVEADELLKRLGSSSDASGSDALDEGGAS